MARREQIKQNESALEKGSRWYRNFNAVVGGVALLGTGVVASPAVVAGLSGYATFNFVQAGIGEAGRQYAKKKRLRKEKDERK